eukprot:12185290-Ditylum_brightwellii.AAC.1
MDLLLYKHDRLASSVVDSIKHELDKRNIGGGYNTTRLMSFFKKHTNHVVAKINRLEGGDEEEGTLIGERCHLFNTWMVHCWGGKLQGLSEDWRIPRALLCGAIMVWFMGLLEKQ